MTKEASGSSASSPLRYNSRDDSNDPLDMHRLVMIRDPDLRSITLREREPSDFSCPQTLTGSPFRLMVFTQEPSKATDSDQDPNNGATETRSTFTEGVC
jgi:hypothetical protein